MAELEKPNALHEILLIADQLPLVVLQDINQRIGDWLASGGNKMTHIFNNN